MKLCVKQILLQDLISRCSSCVKVFVEVFVFGCDIAGHPALDVSMDTSLEEPDMNHMKLERFNRNRDMMRVTSYVLCHLNPQKYFSI